MNSREPLVSVCIPSYNHAKYLKQSLGSVARQTYQNIEVIVVDDGSSDNSLAIAQDYASQKTNFRVYAHPKNENRGISQTANFAFQQTKGKYWAGLCSDDAWYPNKIEREVEFLETNQNTGFVYSYADIMDEDGKLTNNRIGEKISDDDQIAELIQKNPIPALTALVRRNLLDEVGHHHEDLVYSDWELWIKLATKAKVGFIPESLAQYRVHSYNTSIGIEPSVNFGHIREMYLSLAETARDPFSELSKPQYRDLINELLKNLSNKEAAAELDEYYRAVAIKNYSKARMAFQRAIYLSPFIVLNPRRFASLLKHLAVSKLFK